jgi:hypothetical protein
MRRHQYQRRSQISPEQETLPCETDCTILVRQSTAEQRDRSVFSKETHPDELRWEAIDRYGFAPECVHVIDLDMGIGAYTTTIEDRPGLKHWLYELLPSGQSKVLLVSTEDRLFRDRDEVEHNRFIRQVEQFGGWVICGSNIYNFRLEMHRENFRQACKSSRYYIESHVKRRLHPAAQRAAMAGRYTGGAVPWGYVVDYDDRSPTYKHLVVYDPHALLLVEHVFRYFARLTEPTVTELVRHWEREGLVWPFYGPEVHAHVVRAADACRTRDKDRGGYRFHRLQAHRMLTDVVYLGWRVRGGEVAMDPTTGQPRVCHPPLIEPTLFWWCYDHLETERPVWAPAREDAAPRRIRTRQPYQLSPGEVRFLVPGRVRCAIHERPFTLAEHHSRTTLICNNLDWQLRRDTADCATPRAAVVERVLCEAFAEQLVLDDHDLAVLARLADRRIGGEERREDRLRKEIEEQRATLRQVMALAVRPDNAALSEEFLAQAREAKATMQAREADLASLAEARPVSSRGWGMAQRAAGLAERIRTTFPDWSRAAQAKVLGLALDDALLGYVDRQVLGLWVRWQGGRESRIQVTTSRGKKLRWTPEEHDALVQYYAQLGWPALRAMLPSRSRHAIQDYARALRLERPDNGEFLTVPPVVVPGPVVVNALADKGFRPIVGAVGGNSISVHASRSWSRICARTAPFAGSTLCTSSGCCSRALWRCARVTCPCASKLLATGCWVSATSGCRGRKSTPGDSRCIRNSARRWRRHGCQSGQIMRERMPF